MRNPDLNMKISLVIPTYNRPEHLENCLKSIIDQSYLPHEIFIVDNSLVDGLDDLIRYWTSEFKKKNVSLVYKRNTINSLTAARNLGAEATTGDIISFLDDDVTISQNYFKEIINVFKKYKTAKGVQGYIQGEDNRGRIRNLFNRIFFNYHTEKNGCRVLPSVSTTYPLQLSKTIPCEWISGSNQNYKREIFQNLCFDENLMKYCEGEDLDFSYRVFKKYSGSLFITPDAKVEHHVALNGRAIGKEQLYMFEVYGLYLFFKLFKPTLLNISKYSLNRIGKLIIMFTIATLRYKRGKISEIGYYLAAICYSVINYKKLIRGNLGFFNNRLS